MLNNDDIQMLMEALDALEKQAGKDGFMGAMLGLMLSKDKEEANRHAEQEMKEAEEKTAAIKDRIILLKAKLIMMKDRNTVNEAADFLKNQ